MEKSYYTFTCLSLGFFVVPINVHVKVNEFVVPLHIFTLMQRFDYWVHVNMQASCLLVHEIPNSEYFAALNIPASGYFNFVLSFISI